MPTLLGRDTSGVTHFVVEHAPSFPRCDHKNEEWTRVKPFTPHKNEAPTCLWCIAIASDDAK